MVGWCLIESRAPGAVASAKLCCLVVESSGMSLGLAFVVFVLLYLYAVQHESVLLYL